MIGSISVDPGAKQRFFVVGQRFFRRHFVVGDALPERTPGFVVGIERGAAVAAAKKVFPRGEVEFALWVGAAMAFEAAADEDLGDLFGESGRRRGGREGLRDACHGEEENAAYP